MAESLDSEATPYTLALRVKLLETITPAVELIAQDIPSAFLPSSYMWAKQSGLTVIDGCNRLLAHSCVAEEVVNLALSRRT